MNRRGLMAVLFAPFIAEKKSYSSLQYLWLDFVQPMNVYIEKLNNGENNIVSLRKALKAWRKLEKEMEWGKL